MVDALRRDRAVRLLVPLFFVSGLTALIYQSIWARQLQLVFGTSQFAIATVLHHCIDLFLGPPMGQLRGRSSRRRKRMAHFTST